MVRRDDSNSLTSLLNRCGPGDFTSVNLGDCKNVRVLTLRTAVSNGIPCVLDTVSSSSLEYLRFSMPAKVEEEMEAYKRLGEQLCGMKFPESFKGVQFIFKGESTLR